MCGVKGGLYGLPVNPHNNDPLETSLDELSGQYTVWSTSELHKTHTITMSSFYSQEEVSVLKESLQDKDKKVEGISSQYHSSLVGFNLHSEYDLLFVCVWQGEQKQEIERLQAELSKAATVEESLQRKMARMEEKLSTSDSRGRRIDPSIFSESVDTIREQMGHLKGSLQGMEQQQELMESLEKVRQ